MLECDVSPHGAQDIQHTDARGVDANMGQQQVRARCDARRDEKERRGRDIRRHVYVGCQQATATREADNTLLTAHGVAKPLQHTLGMIARRGGLGHRGGTLGVQAGKQHTGLDLRTGHRQIVMNALQRLAAGNMQRWRTALGALDTGAHQFQRVHHPAHGTLAQGNVPREFGIERLPRQQATQQPDAGARIPHIQSGGGDLQAVQTHTVNGDLTVLGTLDRHTHGAKCCDRCQGVLPLEKAAHPGSTLGEGTQHDRTV